MARSLALLAVVLCALPPTEARREYEVALKDWPEGPIRYIIRAEEEKAFRRLKTDAERALYIERFWRIRDPEPDTLTNEYRTLFWERVSEANRLFLDSAWPGWKTDRGKIHILYGPPTDIEENKGIKVNENQGVGVLRWIYQGRPGGRTDVGNVVVIPFERDLSGEYRVSYDPTLASEFFNVYLFRPGNDPDRAFQLNPENRTRLQVMLDLGRLQEVPPEAEVFLEGIETTESYRANSLPTLIEQYRHPDRDGTLVSLTVNLDNQSEERPARLLARLTAADDPGNQRILDESAFRHSDAGGRRVAQARIQVPPGEYEVLTLAVDGIKAITSVYRGKLVVRPPRTTVHMSDITVASLLEPVAYRALVNYDEPFYVGAYKVVPRTDSMFTPGDAVRLLSEVYEGTAPFNATYQVQMKDGETWKSVGRPIQAEQPTSSIGWQLQTTPRWPIGEYRVRIEVLDAEGRQVDRLVQFELRPPSEGSASQSSEPRSSGPQSSEPTMKLEAGGERSSNDASPSSNR